MVRQAIEKLIAEINLNAKTKEILTVVMRVLDYSEDEINLILKEKKKNFLGFFK